ncbi:MAG: hypothetical protein KJN68_03485 [Bacteroidia bacterium]|nr:hypothetical protein [Bacteroidia bacterium]
MSSNKVLTKERIKIFLIAGLVYAAIMAGFDYYSGVELNLKKFLLHFLIFGLLMAVFLPMFRKKRNT